jgi:hypothetical protein
MKEIEMIKEEKKFLPADFTKKVMAKIDDEIEMRRKRAALLWCVVAATVVIAVVAVLIRILVNNNIFGIGDYVRIYNDNINQVAHNLSLSIISSISGLMPKFSDVFLHDGIFSIPLPIIIFFNLFILMIGYILVERRTNSAKRSRK